MTEPRWLDWGRRLAAIAQTGLAYGPNEYERERYEGVLAIAHEMIAEGANMDVQALEQSLAQDTGHITPKVDVRGVVFRDEEILLVREKIDSRWTLPGGWADVGETPSLAAVREVREESGYATRAAKLLAVYDRRLHDHPPTIFHVYKLFFLCELLDEEQAEPVHETTGVGFFAADTLPELSQPRTTASQLARFFEHRFHPGWPTDFD